MLTLKQGEHSSIHAGWLELDGTGLYCEVHNENVQVLWWVTSKQWWTHLITLDTDLQRYSDEQWNWLTVMMLCTVILWFMLLLTTGILSYPLWKFEPLIVLHGLGIKMLDTAVVCLTVYVLLGIAHHDRAYLIWKTLPATNPVFWSCSARHSDRRHYHPLSDPNGRTKGWTDGLTDRPTHWLTNIIGV